MARQFSLTEIWRFLIDLYLPVYPISSSENEDYPGEDVVEIVNLKGETTTVYKLADGRYMDRIERIFIFDGVDTWTDINGAEWNQAVN